MCWVCTLATKYYLVDDACKPYSAQREIWCDLLIQEGKSAEHCNATTLKQLTGVGSETWQSELNRYNEICEQGTSGEYLGMKDGIAEPTYWSAFCITTDNGSDERKMREYVAFLLALIPWMVVIIHRCYLHQVPSLISAATTSDYMYVCLSGTLSGCLCASSLPCC